MSAPQSKAAIASAVASSGVEILVKTLFGPCTGAERAEGFTPLKNPRSRKGYRRHNSSSSRVTPLTGCEEKSRDTKLFDPIPETRRVKFDAFEEAKTCFQDDAILTLRKCDIEDDAISAITTFTLDEMDKSLERDDAISVITSITLEEMAQRFSGSTFRPEKAASCKPNWQPFQNWHEDGDLRKSQTNHIYGKREIIPIQKERNPTMSHKPRRNPVRSNIPTETLQLQEEKIREEAAESYEIVIARLNYLKRSLEERQAKKRDIRRSRSSVSIVTQDYMNEEELNGLEFGEI